MKLAFKIQKGTLSAVSREVSRSYVILKEKYPSYSEEELARLVWDRWLPINRERIWEDESETRYLRFEEICKRREGRGLNDNIFTVFFDILYIENGTDPPEKQNYKIAAKKLYEDFKELSIDFKSEYKSMLLKAKEYRKEQKKELRCKNCPPDKQKCKHCKKRGTDK